MPETQRTKRRDACGDTGDPTCARFSITVDAPLDQAFRVFTSELDSWWPREHHIGGAEMAVAILEPHVGGRWYELGVDGMECDWGVVLAWDPPHHLALSWHLDGDFRYDPDGAHASRVDVWFESVGERTTAVILEHSGLDRHGPTWPRLREGISRGWPADLHFYAQSVEVAAGADAPGGTCNP